MGSKSRTEVIIVAMNTNGDRATQRATFGNHSTVME